ncbi:hypothetical protein EXIGLDRAFT_33639 [Exidia glandulosa HHB12029]|uniref:Uncharacterized protein n=1 Tax=Exidia glandulosa HHB12029 TaxID=1314781 RepID=A0A165ITE0_EXIGL|nr:hypothetical protein EXIGLDRAFT_33639 [Exidia glandulosa HHB12029]
MFRTKLPMELWSSAAAVVARCSPGSTTTSVSVPGDGAKVYRMSGTEGLAYHRESRPRIFRCSVSYALPPTLQGPPCAHCSLFLILLVNPSRYHGQPGQIRPPSTVEKRVYVASFQQLSRSRWGRADNPYSSSSSTPPSRSRRRTPAYS